MRLGGQPRRASIGRRPLAAALPTVAGFLIAATPIRADEPLFGYVNTTDLLPKGKWQLEQWATYRGGAEPGRHRSVEGRTEFDYGATDSLQLSAYLNYSHGEARLTPEEARLARAAPAGEVSRTTGDSVTAEAVWRLASPYLHPAGLAVLADVTAGREPPVFGIKAIIQKNFRDDTLVAAANGRLELGEREISPATAERRDVRRIELSLGASYRFRPNWSGAIELRHRRRHVEGGLRNAALLLGPTLHYGGARWFWTMSALVRVSSSMSRPRSVEFVSARALLAEDAQWDGVRLRVGRTF